MDSKSLSENLPPDWEMVWQAAVHAREHAYAPYSNFKVGSAFKVQGWDQPVAGCNVENASYGATICAERNALFQKVSKMGEEDPLEYLILVTDTEKPTVPCAQCLQVLSEFCPSQFPIFLGNLQGIAEKVTLGDLLPRPFNEF
jgi:homotetrameric cytidine deaminase